MQPQGASVVVTGGNGFLGRQVCRELTEAGAQVTAVGRSTCDLLDRAAIDRMLAQVRPDAVIHLAAVVGGIGANRTEPGRFFYENALMGIELIEACRVAAIEKTLVAGTVCAYPKFAPVPFSEDSLWDGYPEETNAPYGLAKKMLLVQAQSYRQQYGQNIVYVLPVNLYGPGDNFDLRTGHVIPGMVRRMTEARDSDQAEVVLWGDGSPTREFLYVEDAARAFRAALERYDGEEPVNLGSGEEIAMRDLAELIRDAVGYRGAIEWDPSQPNGQPRRLLDTERAVAAFGWKASVPLREGLASTVRWWEAQQS